MAPRLHTPAWSSARSGFKPGSATQSRTLGNSVIFLFRFLRIVHEGGGPSDLVYNPDSRNVYTCSLTLWLDKFHAHVYSHHPLS